MTPKGKQGPKKPHSANFKPGQSGNPGGKCKLREWTAALNLALAEIDPVEKVSKLHLAARACVDAAIERDIAAINHIADRIEGKVPQAQILTDADGEAITSDNSRLFDALLMRLEDAARVSVTKH